MCSRVCSSLAFQSTPPAEARGDNCTLTRTPNPSWFQSTPPAEARGDEHLSLAFDTFQSFNPLPPPKRGETIDRTGEAGTSEVSIHSPRRSEGRLYLSFLAVRPREFQSTPGVKARTGILA